MANDEICGTAVVPDTGVLDDPVGESLRGHHAHLARRIGRAGTYLPEVATFAAIGADPEPGIGPISRGCSGRANSPICSAVRHRRRRTGKRSSRSRAGR